MKTIIAVYPILEAYGVSISKHMKVLSSRCKDKNTVLIFSTLDNDCDTEDDFEEYDYSDYDDKSEMSFELVQRDDDRTSEYWFQVRDQIPESSFINIGESFAELKSLHYQALIETSEREKNYLKTHAYFLEMFGPVHEIYKDLDFENAEVVITDAYIGTCLCAMYPQEFIIDYEYPMDFHVELEKHTVWESVKEFQCFEKWNIHSRPYLAGSFLNPAKEPVWFELFCNPTAKLGKVSGLISDGYGLAKFEGTLRRSVFRFQKSYFNLAIKSDKTRWIEDRPIFYEFDPSRRGGKYSWEYYPSDVGALYTKAFVARAMYHINDE